MTYSYTESTSFTITHARELASRVAADLHICSVYYGDPSETMIPDYEEELAALLHEGYVEQYEFGFKEEEKRIVCWRYTVNQYGNLVAGDRPGKVVSWADISSASYYNYLWYSSKWFDLSSEARERFEGNLPIQRVGGAAPEDGAGYWEADKNYAAGGRVLARKTFRPFQ